MLVLMYILMNVGWVLGMFAQQGFSLDQIEVGDGASVNVYPPLESLERLLVAQIGRANFHTPLSATPTGSSMRPQ